ncbi:MAG TPA: epoxide hydrolase N-terminal domain-containing protein, partial [Variovorax sp.]|nr:epoxide hydrolase N-terminal domain-containing protein [Variovorax sp.]
MTPRPFQARVPDAAIDDLRTRLALTRFPDQPPGDPWATGTDLAWMRELVDHWRTRFDWRVHEARLNAFALPS